MRLVPQRGPCNAVGGALSALIDSKARCVPNNAVAEFMACSIYGIDNNSLSNKVLPLYYLYLPAQNDTEYEERMLPLGMTIGLYMTNLSQLHKKSQTSVSF
jgi:hypothetical protein